MTLEHWICERCEEHYYTGAGWDDQCYCIFCYFTLFPVPEWMDTWNLSVTEIEDE